MFTLHEIESRFGHTVASIDGVSPKEDVHKEIRFAFMHLAHVLNETVPDSREKEVAFQELETASMWFHKSLAHSLQ